MALNWDDSLLLGNAEIDEQHRQMFVHFEKLSLACLEGQCEAALKELLQYLGDYANQHFLQEEAFMVRNRYPRLPEQQAQHADFRRKVKDLQEMDLKNMDPQQLSLLVYRQLIHWFNRHITQLDQEMVNYIRAQQHY